MSEEQRNFLCELKKLLDKYGINFIQGEYPENIKFISKDSTLIIKNYNKGVFSRIIVITDEYKPDKELIE